MTDEKKTLDEDSSIPCTICHHNLYNPVYRICLHPILNVTVCSLCLEDFEQEWRSENKEMDSAGSSCSDVCSWCASGGELFICGDGTECPHSFCDDCIRENLGDHVLAEIRLREEWECLVCRPDSLKELVDQATQGIRESIYSKSRIESHDESFSTIVDYSDDYKHEEVLIMRTIVDEVNLGTEMLEDDKIVALSKEIRDEIESEGRITDETAKQAIIDTELETYTFFWNRHYEIMLKQEADQEDKLRLLGIDARTCVPEYDRNSRVEAVGTDAAEDVAWAEQEMKMTEEEHKAKFRADMALTARDRCQSVTMNKITPLADLLQGWTEIEYALEFEDSIYSSNGCEDGAAKFAKLEQLAKEDGFVSLHASARDVSDLQEQRYPHSFEKILPKAVIKALYHNKKNQSDLLEVAIEKFAIPEHVLIVMKYAATFVPSASFSNLPFADSIHPSISKVFLLSLSPVELMTLCECYDLDASYGQVDDCGSSKDVFSLYSQHLHATGQKAKLKESDMREAEEVENAQIALAMDRRNSLAFSSAKRSHRHRSYVEKEAENGARDNLRGSEIPANARSTSLESANRSALSSSFATASKDGSIEVVSKDGCAFLVRSVADEEDAQKITKSVQQSTARSCQRIRGITIGLASASNFDGRDATAVPTSIQPRPRTNTQRQPSNISSGSGASNLKAADSKDTQETTDGCEFDHLDNVNMAIENIFANVNAATPYVTKTFESSHKYDGMVEDADIYGDVPSLAKGNSVNARAKTARKFEDSAISFDVPESCAADRPSAATVVVGTTTVVGPSSSSTSSSSSSASKRVKLFPLIDLSAEDDEEVIEDVFEQGACNNSKFPPRKWVEGNYNKIIAKEAIKKSGIGKRNPVYASVAPAIPASPEVEFVRIESQFQQLDDLGDPSSSFNKVKPGVGNLLRGAKRDASAVTVDASSKSIVTAPVKRANNGNGRVSLKQSTLSWDKKGVETATSLLNSPALGKKLGASDMINAYYSEDDPDRVFIINEHTKASSDPNVNLVTCLVKELKDHQKEAVRFIWANTVSSIYSLKRRGVGGGCILAHCMGLGKTLSVIAFTLTLLTNPLITSITTKPTIPTTGASPKARVDCSPVTCHAFPHTLMNGQSDNNSDETAAAAHLLCSPSPSPAPERRFIQCILVVAPVNTLQNWELEYKKWVPGTLQPYCRVSLLTSFDSDNSANKATGPVGKRNAKCILKSNSAPKTANGVYSSRLEVVRQWFLRGGILIMGYEMFRILTSPEYFRRNGDGSVKDFDEMKRCLVNPGPDVVVADEAHVIKDAKAKISQALGQMRTRRRIALTGSPLQNNLEEYWCMVNWVKPRVVLGTLKQFRKRFIKPIKDGEHKDASRGEIMAMKKKSFILHKRLKTLVDRKDISVLADVLPPLREFTITIHMAGIQKFLYKLFLSKLLDSGANMTRLLFVAYQNLLRLWNHPCCAVLKTLTDERADDRREQRAANKAKGKGGKDAKSNPVTLDALLVAVSPTAASYVANGAAMSQEIDRDVKQIEQLMLKADNADVRAEDGSDVEDDDDDDDDDDDEYHPDAVDDDAFIGEVEDIGEYDANRVSIDLEEEPLAVHFGEPPSEAADIVVEDAGFVAGLSRDPAKMSSESLGASSYTSLGGNSFSGSGSDKSRGRQRSRSNGATGKGKTRAKSSIAKDDCDDGATSTGDEIEADAEELMTSLPTDWWRLAPADGASVNTISTADFLQQSNKFVVFMTLLARSVNAGDKMLVFSQSIVTLDVLELVLGMSRWGDVVGVNATCTKTPFSKWVKGHHYMRLDGASADRQPLINKFNANDGIKLFIISTKAGNMGINLQSANRVVIFDSSWNPAHDLQAIFRCYRYGQKKSVFVYRFLAAGSMEEKIYKKQVTKQALAARVVDAQMPDNQFTLDEKAELMTFNEGDRGEGADEAAVRRALEVINTGSRDEVLLELVRQHQLIIKSLEDQGTLLKDNEGEHLTKEEQAEAEAEESKEFGPVMPDLGSPSSSAPTATGVQLPAPLAPPPPLAVPSLSSSSSLNLPFSSILSAVHPFISSALS